jgi:hypothetical protein
MFDPADRKSSNELLNGFCDLLNPYLVSISYCDKSVDGSDSIIATYGFVGGSDDSLLNRVRRGEKRRKCILDIIDSGCDYLWHSFRINVSSLISSVSRFSDTENVSVYALDRKSVV